MDREPTDAELRPFGNIKLEDWIVQPLSGSKEPRQKHIMNTIKGECSFQWLSFNSGINTATLKKDLLEMKEEGAVEMWKLKRKWRIKKCA